MRWLFVVFMVFQASVGWAQALRTALPVEGGLIKTAAGTSVIFNDYKGLGLNFELHFGKAQVKATDQPTLFFVNDQMVQVLVVPVERYQKATPTETLQSYIAAEAEYTGLALGAILEPKLEPVALTPTQPAYRWSYPQPAGLDGDVKQQLFINFLQDGFVIGLGSAQFQGQRVPAIQKLLLDMARGIRFSAAPISIPARK